MRPIRALVLAAATALSAAAAPPADASAKPAVYQAAFSQAAVGGYDVVSYFTGQGTPVKGDADYAAQHRGVTYWFANAANRDAFRANPARYLPQYGGYCAWAAAQGYTAPGRPQHYRIVDGKLYLNYDAGVQQKWEKDIPGFIAKADANWPAILAK